MGWGRVDLQFCGFTGICQRAEISLCPDERRAVIFQQFPLISEQSPAVQRRLGCSRQLAPLLPYLCWTQHNSGMLSRGSKTRRAFEKSSLRNFA